MGRRLLEINLSVNSVENILRASKTGYACVREGVGDVVFHNGGHGSGSWFNDAVEKTRLCLNIQ